MKEIHAIHRTYKQGAELPYRLDAIQDHCDLLNKINTLVDRIYVLTNNINSINYSIDLLEAHKQIMKKEISELESKLSRLRGDRR
jgi:hypothetical protein